MDKAKVLEKVLIYDRILRFTIDLLNGIKSEIRADVEEARIIGEALLEGEELRYLRDFLLKVEEEFLLKLRETLESVYDEYEIFNFDITFLSNLPEEIEREMERLDLVGTVNAKLELLRNSLSQACSPPKPDRRIEVILIPFKVYCELLNHAIEFNKKFENP